MSDVFKTLNQVNVNGHTEQKGGLTYLSWAWAWTEVKKHYPDATYTIYEADNGCFYHTDGKTCWVKTGVTIDGIEHIEYLPIMDFKNKSIPVGEVTSTDANKTIQRSLTKACARHGLGLYIYAGEDLPEQSVEPLTKEHIADIKNLLADMNIKESEFLKKVKRKSFSDILDSDYEGAIKFIKFKMGANNGQ